MLKKIQRIAIVKQPIKNGLTPFFYNAAIGSLNWYGKSRGISIAIDEELQGKI
jgi:hypothetical protein